MKSITLTLRGKNCNDLNRMVGLNEKSNWLESLRVILAPVLFFLFVWSNQLSAAIEHEAYFRILNEAKEFFNEDFKLSGQRLIFDDRWDDFSGQAYGQTIGPRFVVSIAGGLARNPFIDEDAFRLITCIAMGRKLGGAPVMKLNHTEYVSLPGQADYYASARCMKKWMLNLNRSQNQLKDGHKDYGPWVKALCKSTFQDARDQGICVRSAYAGRQFAWALEVLSGKKPSVDFGQHAPGSLPDEFPDAQCRLNTFLAGALCNADLSVSPSNEELYLGYCSETGIGARPDCWFKN